MTYKTPVSFISPWKNPAPRSEDVWSLALICRTIDENIDIIPQNDVWSLIVKAKWTWHQQKDSFSVMQCGWIYCRAGIKNSNRFQNSNFKIKPFKERFMSCIISSIHYIKQRFGGILTRRLSICIYACNLIWFCVVTLAFIKNTFHWNFSLKSHFWFANFRLQLLHMKIQIVIIEPKMFRISFMFWPR